MKPPTATDSVIGRRARAALASLLQAGWSELSRRATIGPDQRRAKAFGAFGDGAAICFPVAALFGEAYMRIGAGTVVGPYATLSAGVMPGHVPDNDPVISIGERCVIGKGSGVVGHRSIEIGDDVWTGHHVYITDANHGYEDTSLPPGLQFAGPKPVVIRSGAWLGHGTIVLPGATIGRNAVIGAGSIVTGDIPDFSVAVGNPARVVRQFVDGEWTRVTPGPPLSGQEAGSSVAADQPERSRS